MCYYMSGGNVMELNYNDGIINIVESDNIEIKRSSGGIPNSLYESYSAFSNTDGGIIILGLNEIDNYRYKVIGIKDPVKMIDGIMTTLNNPQKIRFNTLTLNDFEINEYKEGSIIVIHIPKADYTVRPVYLNNNINDAYIRVGRGDSRCPIPVLKAMLRDASNEAQDMTLLKDLDYKIVLDKDTIVSYRSRFEELHPKHVFNKLSYEEFLEKIGALTYIDDKWTVTLAGLIVLGKSNYVTYKLPYFLLEYIEIQDGSRYSDRIIYDGTWGEGNLYNFYFKTQDKLNNGVPTAFVMASDNITRLSNEKIILALRELLVNSLVHADYRRDERVRIVKDGNKFVFTNPGSLRVTKEEFYKGIKSNPRNPNIMKMFRSIGLAEETGSGLVYVMDVIKEYGLKELMVDDRPDSVTITLDVTVSKKRNDMTDKEKIIYDVLQEHGPLKRLDIQNYTGSSKDIITRALRSMIAKDIVKVIGTGPNTSYTLN